jgi:hypothetical protein
MDISRPPRPARYRVDDLGDRLVIHLRAHRSWAVIAFLTVWLAGWTFGGVSALFGLTEADWSGRVFLAVWLCGWVFGEGFAAAAIVWQLLGREVVTVSRDELEVRRTVGKFSRTKRYEAPLVRDVVAVPADADGVPRKQFRVLVSFDDDSATIGEALGRQDAEQLASLVRARLRPRTWWGEEEQVAVSSARPPAAADGERSPRFVWFRSVWFPLAVIAFVAFCAINTLRSDDDRGRRAYSGRPATAGAATTPRVFAAAMTVDRLQALRMDVDGTPVCGARVSWAAWRCTVRVHGTVGPFAGRTLTYYCDANGMCGPARRS